MANECEVFIELFGEKEEVENFYQKTLGNEEVSWKTRNRLYAINEPFGFDGKNCDTVISFSVNWSPQEEEYIELSKEFPNVKLVVHFFEINMDFYEKMVIENGVVKEDILEDYNGQKFEDYVRSSNG